MSHTTIARSDNVFAVYRHQGDGTHQFLSAGEGAGEDMLMVLRAVADESSTVSEVHAPHLFDGATWLQQVGEDQMREPSAAERLVAEIRVMENEARSRRDAAAYSGGYGDGHADYLRTKAEGMRYAYRILTGWTLESDLSF